MHGSSDYGYDPIFSDPKFQEKYDSLEKRTQHYWRISKEFRSSGVKEVGEALRGTCHIIATSQRQDSLLYKSIIDIEDKIVKQGKKRSFKDLVKVFMSPTGEILPLRRKKINA